MRLRMFFTATMLSVAASLWAEVTINEAGGWFESGYVTWALDENVPSYAVYCRAQGADYTKLDSYLVRNYGSYGRADALGLKAGNYQFKIVPLNATNEEQTASAAESDVISVMAHDRSGFAFTGEAIPGAYKADGTLKNNAIVLYVTKDNVSKVSYTAVKGVNSSKSETYTGFQEVLSEASLKNLTVPLCIRIVGAITSNEFTQSMWGSSAEGLQVKNATTTNGVTIEGVGKDATIWGFGILCRTTNYIELRNFAVMCCKDDCISLDTDNYYTWVHHIDFFYGNAGSDGDQAKGDGSLDVKGDSKYQTYSYNHFWDSGKCSLCGMKSETGPNYLTYHHNWFDHSDSRHPRIRTMSVHIYNNYYDGNAKYGVGATTGADAFVESNYFRNCKFPMMSSLQGNDIYAGTAATNADYATFSGEAGGSIKAYNNYMEGATTSYWPYSGTGTPWTKGAQGSMPSAIDAAVQFDAYEVSARGNKVPATVKAVSGGDAYSNFDTTVDLGVSESNIDTPENAKVKVTAYSGRMNGGDFAWSFNDATEDTNYGVIAGLKTAVVNYKTTLKSIMGDAVSDDGSGTGGDEGSGDEGGSGDDGGSGNVPSGGSYECYFTGGKPSSTFYTITGSYSDSKGTASVNGVTYNYCLKMETKTTITFTTTETLTLTLVFDKVGANIKIDGTKVATTDGYVLTYELAAGSHTLTKADSNNLYYINMSGGNGIEDVLIDTDNADAPVYDLMGRRVNTLQRGKIYIKSGKKFMIH